MGCERLDPPGRLGIKGGAAVAVPAGKPAVEPVARELLDGVLVLRADHGKTGVLAKPQFVEPGQGRDIQEEAAREQLEQILSRESPGSRCR